MSPRCPGGNHKGPIQQFTEVCLACGHNIYETDAEYEAALDRELATDRVAEKEHALRAKQAADRGPCPHLNVQQFSEICLDCGKNIYE